MLAKFFHSFQFFFLFLLTRFHPKHLNLFWKFFPFNVEDNLNVFFRPSFLSSAFYKTNKQTNKQIPESFAKKSFLAYLRKLMLMKCKNFRNFLSCESFCSQSMFGNFLIENTVKLVYSGHLQFLKKVSIITRCPVYRGFQAVYT